MRAGVSAFIAAVPRDAKVYDLELEDNKQLVEASLATKAAGLILVEITLG